MTGTGEMAKPNTSKSAFISCVRRWMVMGSQCPEGVQHDDPCGWLLGCNHRQREGRGDEESHEDDENCDDEEEEGWV